MVKHQEKRGLGMTSRGQSLVDYAMLVAAVGIAVSVAAPVVYRYFSAQAAAIRQLVPVP
jgi:hypothetical protein